MIHVESCKKLSNESAHELIQFFCQITFFKSLQTTQIMVVCQNVLSMIMLKNVKLSDGNVRLLRIIVVVLSNPISFRYKTYLPIQTQQNVTFNAVFDHIEALRTSTMVNMCDS